MENRIDTVPASLKVALERLSPDRSEDIDRGWLAFGPPAKCSDIHDNVILAFLADHQGEWTTHWEPMAGGLASVRTAVHPDTPERLLKAKLLRLKRRGLVDGCGCDCRGDWEITDAGLSLIGRERVMGLTPVAEQREEEWIGAALRSQAAARTSRRWLEAWLESKRRGQT